MMKRVFITTLLAFAVLAGFACAGNGELSKRQARKIKEYFARVLQGAECGYSNGKAIKVDDIDQLRVAVWNCWREAVNGYSEEKLIAPFTIEEPRDTGYWRLPEDLEPSAVMPYYFIKKGEQPSAGYPLFLYMHGSGDKKSEWETGFRLCHS